jgi:hypothetical protein
VTAEAALFGLLVLGLFGLVRLGLQVAAEALAAAAAARPLGGRPAPQARAVSPEGWGLAGLAAGGLIGLFLWAMGVRGFWPLWAAAFLGGGAWGLGYWRREEARRREETDLMGLLEELALALSASGGAVEPALRLVAAGPGPARAALRRALARAGQAGAPAVLTAWAGAFRPELLGPVAAAVVAAAEAGLDPAGALRTAADTTAGELLGRRAARLRAAPDALLPFIGLGVFAPILGLTMVPLLAAIITQIAATTRLSIP